MADGLQVALNGGIGYRVVVRNSTRALASVVTSAADYPDATPGTLSTGAAAIVPLALLLDSADYAATGMTPVLRIKGACMVNDTAPGNTMKIGLYPVGTPAGGVGILNPVLGTVVSGSQITFATPAANSKSAAVSSGDFTFPSAGWFCLGMNASAAMAGNSEVVFAYRLEVRLT